MRVYQGGWIGCETMVLGCGGGCIKTQNRFLMKWDKEHIQDGLEITQQKLLVSKWNNMYARDGVNMFRSEY